SFDPFSIVDAWTYDIPSIYYCNLFWYWDVFDKKSLILSYKKQLQYYKKIKKFSKIKEFFCQIFNRNSHHGIFLGFILSTNSFTRRFCTLDKLIKIFQNEINLTLCDFYIPKICKPILKKKQIIIQLSGSRNGIVTHEENLIYLKLCLL